MRHPFVVADLGNLRHNYGTVRDTYTHWQLDVFVPPADPRWTGRAGFPVGRPGAVCAPDDGVLVDYNEGDTGAGGFWSKYVEDSGLHWYFAHGAAKPTIPKGTRLAAGAPFQQTGWSGNAGPGNASIGAGRRTEPHCHADCLVRVDGAWYHVDTYPMLCAIWGYDPRAYKHDGVPMPSVLLGSTLPVVPGAPANPPRAGGAFSGRVGRDPGRQDRNVLRRILDFLRGGVVLPSDEEVPW